MTKIPNMRRAAAGLLCLILAGTLTLAQRRDTADVLMQRAIQKEIVDGDPKAAIELYKKVVSTKGVSPGVAAGALLRMGISYEKLGDAEAKKTYQRIVSEYGNEKTTASEATRRLALITTAASPNLAMRFICNGCGDPDSSITPDGRYLAAIDSETRGVTIRDLVSGESKGLMTTEVSPPISFANFPLMSPDQKLVVYNFFIGRVGVQLRLIGTAPGSKPIVLVNNPDYTFFHPGEWSLDGKSILVMATKSDGTLELAWVSATDGAIRRIRSLQRLAIPSRPRLSPDGRHIVYSAPAVNPNSTVAESAEQDEHIYVVDSNGSGPETALVKGPKSNLYPVWTLDGSHVLFVSNRSSEWGLWSIEVRNGQASGFPRLERPDTGRVLLMGLSNAGSLYFAQVKPSFDQVFIEQLRRGAPGSPAVASGDSTFGGQSPGWSPDGKYLAFARLRAGSQNVYDVVVRTAQTGEERIYSNDGLVGNDRLAFAYEMLWFSDSKSFLAWTGQTTTPATSRVLYRVNIDSKQWEPLATLDARAMAPPTGISADDQLLFKGARDPKDAQFAAPVNNRPFDRILTLDLKTGQPKSVLMLPEPAYGFRLSPDRQTFMLYVKPDPKKEEFYMARMALDGNNYRRLGGPFSLAPVGWTGDNRNLVLGVVENPIDPPASRRSRIMQMSIDTGALIPTGITVSGLNALTVNVNGQIAYSATSGASRELWALDNISSLFKTR